MILHYETVSEDLLFILKKLMSAECFSGFRLVGGTALSLMRGHRKSIDIDLFTDVDYGTMPTEEIRDFIESNFAVHEGTETLSERAMGYHLRLSDGVFPKIKVDLFYTDTYIFPPVQENGLRLADQREIAAMKLLAIAGPVKRRKDYWDIHELLWDFKLSDMIAWGLERHPYSLTEEEIISGLQDLEKSEESPEGIISLNVYDYWELKVLGIKQCLNEYINSRN